MPMPFPRVLRYLQGAIRGQVIGRHGWVGKTACRAFKAVGHVDVQNPYAGMGFNGCLDRQGGQGVSGRKQAWRRLVGQTVVLAGAGQSVAERTPFPPPPRPVRAGATPKFF